MERYSSREFLFYFSTILILGSIRGTTTVNTFTLIALDHILTPSFITV